MSYSVSRQVSNVQSGEVDWLWKPRNVRTGNYGVILIHGASTPDQWAGAGWPSADRLAASLANAGIPCVAGYFGTNSANTADPWANDTHMARITSALTYLATTGASSAKAHVIGCSMGGAAAVRWAGTNPTKAASVTGIIPMSNITAIYTANNPAGAQAGIGTAWGVTYPTALPSGANLTTHAAAILAAAIPLQLLYSTVDPYIATSDITALAAAAGGTATAIDSTYGHANGTMAQVDVPALITFLKAHGA